MTCGCGIGHLAVCSSGKKLGTASSISATRKATIDVIFQRGKSSILVVRRLGATRRDRRQRGFDDLDLDAGGDLDLDRSEEHTSELQSLMRISYAVFCLKQKNT